MSGRILAGLSACLILGGAAGILAGALGPWAQVTLFHNITLHISGLLFAGGGLCLSAAVLVLLGMRRVPVLCLAAALFVLHWAAQARVMVPRDVKHQVIGMQLALFPLNRLLDQFHINDVDVSDWTVPDPQLLASGLTWTWDGAAVLLVGSLLGLPTDPAVRWFWQRAVPARCRACGARWTRARAADFCPQCGTATVAPDPRRCPHCGRVARRLDRFCIGCGASRA